MDEAGFSSGSRIRLARVSSSRQEEVQEDEEEVRHEDEEILDADPPHGEEGEEGYPGGPMDTSLLIYYHDLVARRVLEGEERPTIKSVNHTRNIFYLFKPEAQWFNDVVVSSGLGGLCMTGELTITLHDVQCLLHLPIRGSLLNHSRIQRVEAIEWMVDYLGMDPNMGDYECRETSGAHIRFSRLRELYENHLVAAAESEQESDGLFTKYHRA
ncbi:uncharacterized protein LOC131619945 [Vicia villosa]|uniref:uncharacterized protein LOC131619945 n=1 Tax=Vicia villosa TaxID=3911 RepID=UPI00273A77C0|nr:uncharacterized protein LOC131619945 [Vicia villosa]